MAHPAGVAVGGIQAPGPVRQPAELGSQTLEPSDAAVQVSGTGGDEVENVTARDLAAVAQCHDPADLAEGEPHRLGRPDERETVGGLRRVVAIARCGSVRRIEDMYVLVVADRLGRNAADGGELTDAHEPLTFQSGGTLRVTSVDIEVLTVDGCPHRTETVARLRVALAALGTVAVVNERVIASAADAAAAGMHGSPTVLIDGRDLFTVQSVEPSWSCRLYPRPAGMDGAPGLDALIAALAGRAGSSDRHG